MQEKLLGASTMRENIITSIRGTGISE